MDSPAPPPVPDPAQVAQVQGGLNSDAARLNTQLNRADQVTPYGSLHWTNNRAFDQTGYDAALAAYKASNGVGADGSAISTPDKNSFYSGDDKWTSNITLDPRVQSLIDSNLASSQGLQGATDAALSRVGSVLGQGIDYSALPGAPDPYTMYSLAGDLTKPTAPRLDTTGPGYGSAGTLNAGNLTDVSKQISGQQGTVGQSQGLLSHEMQQLYGLGSLPTASEATRKQVEDALYARETSRLDPQYASQEDQLRSTLLNKGLTEGSEAWNTEMANFARGKNDAYSTANWDAITKGGAEQSRLLADELGVRSQGVNELGAASGVNSNAVQALGSMLGQQTSQYNAKTNAFGTQQAANVNQQNANTGTYRAVNDARSTQQGLDLSQALGQSQIAGNMFAMGSSARGNALSEQERLRTMVLNELASLRGGQQVQPPTFGATPSGATVPASPYAQSVYNSFSGQQQQYAADVGSNNATMAGGASVAAAVMMML